MADGPAVGTGYLRIVGDFSQINAQAVGLFSSQRFKKYGKVAGAGLAAGLAVAGVGKVLFDIGKQFDDVYDNLRTQTGKTGKELEGLKDSFREVVRAVPADFDTAGKAVAGLNQRLGLTGKPLERVSKQLTELSRITGTDVEENVTSVSRAFGDWEVKTRKQSKTLDFFFRASQASGASVSELTQLVVQFGAPLRRFGFSVEEATSMFALFEKSGVNIQTMIPGLKLALSEFLEAGKDPQKELAKTFAGIEDGSIKAADAIEIFGKRAGADMVEAIEQGRFEFQDFTKVIADGDDTIRKAGRQTMDFGEHWTKFKNNVLLTLEPVATRVFEGIGDAMKDVTKIMSDKDLTSAEKFERLRDLAVGAFGDLVSKAAEVAPKVVGALAEGLTRAWGQMNPLGKLFTAAAVIRMVGGRGALLGTGARIGGFLGLGMATGASTALAGGAAAGGAGAAVAGAAGGGLLGKLKSIKWARVGGLGIGIALADGVLSEFGRRTETTSPDLFEALRAKAGVYNDPGALNALSRAFGAGGDEQAQDLLETLEGIQGRTAGITDAELAHVHALARAADLTDEQADSLDAALAPAIELSQRIKGKMSLTDVANDWGKNLRKMAGLSKREMGNIRDVLDRDSERGTALLSKHFDQAVKNINRAMDQGVIGTKRGAQMIERVLREQLELYGLSPSAIDSLAPKRAAISKKGGHVPRGGFQRGGIIRVPGMGLEDTVPLFTNGGVSAAVAPGEDLMVANRHQRPLLDEAVSERFGVSGLREFFKRFAKPHAFAKGGIVGLGKKLQKQGFLVGEHPAFGGVAPVHTGGSYHYSGQALDVNWPDAGAEPSKLDALYNRLKGMPGVVELLWRVANHFDHLHVAMTGGSGKLGSLGGGMSAADIKLPRFSSRFPAFMGPAEGLNKLAEAAEQKFEQRIGRREGAEAGLSFAGVKGGGSAMSLGRKMLLAAGWGANQWPALRELWTRESGWDPNAVNPSSGAYGIPQSLGHGRPYKLGDARAQIAWGLNYIRERYGSPSAALAFHDSHNWYQRGGFVDLWGKGLQHLAPGGVVGPGGAEGRGGSGGGGGARKGGKGDQKFKLGKSLDQITRLDELIDLATRSAMLPGSPAGEELAVSERSKQVRLTKKLLGALTDRRGGLKGLLRNKGLKGPRRQVLEDFLAEMQGVTGKGGRIFDTREALASLHATPAAESERLDQLNELLREQLRLSNLGRLTAERQFDVFKAMPPWAGSFARGGEVPGPVGAPRTAVVHGGEVIGQPGETFITVLVEDGAVDPSKIRVIARDEMGRQVRTASGRGPVVGRKAVAR